MNADKARTKVSLRTLFGKRRKGEMITMLTCYDYPTACFMEEAGLDILLVGDSLGMTILGYDTTLPVTMDIMIAHAQAVRRGSPSAWLVGDMPYMTYQPSVEDAIRNAASAINRPALRIASSWRAGAPLPTGWKRVSRWAFR